MLYERLCPSCQKTMTYSNAFAHGRAERDGACCKTCAGKKQRRPLDRTCPHCGSTQTYTTRQALYVARKKNQVCNTCSASNRVATEEGHAHLKRIASHPGESNPFYGKTHSDETKAVLAEHTRKQNAQRDHSWQFRGYDTWRQKYGEEKAAAMIADLRARKSANATGKGNPMYGRPTPQGAGNGWSGWYKGWFFRSLRELAYMINVIEARGFCWESAEQKKYYVTYTDHKGAARTYRADFIVEGRFMVEVKPLKLMSSPTNQAKEAAAQAFCQSLGLRFILVDPPGLTDQQIRQLHADKLITFTDKYEQLFQARSALPDHRD